MDQRSMDRLQLVNRTYLFHKNFPQTLRARAGFAALLLMLCAHRVLNREWAGLYGLLEGMRRSADQALGSPGPRCRDVQ
jgi:hypothetical protein